MNSSRRSVAALALALLAAAAGAQVNPLAHEATVPWGTNLGSPGAFGRSVAVDATGDGHLDLFVRGGSGNSQILFFDGIWRGASGLNTGISCVDFDAAPGQGPDGTGALAFVDSIGLRLLQRNSLTEDTVGFLSPTTLSTGPWIDARIVRARDLDGTGGLDYVGVKSDGRTLILRANGGITNVEVDVGRDIIDVAFVNWAPGPTFEIAVLSNLGVEIRNMSLVAIDALGVPQHMSIAFAELHVPSAAVDRLAWIGTDTTTGKTSFALLKRSTPRLENQLVLDNSDTSAVRLTTGDVDGDGDSDVVVGRTSSVAPWYLPSASYLQAMPWFVPSAKTAVTWPTQQTLSGLPVLGRFANETTMELVVPAYSGSTAELALFGNNAQDLVGGNVFQFETDDHFTDPEVLFLTDTSNTQLRELQFRMNFLDEELAAQVPENRRIEITIYQAIENVNYVSTVVDKRYWIPWPSSVVNTNLYVAGIKFALPQSDSEDCEFVPRFMEVRQIRVTTNNTVIESGPTYTFGLSRGQSDYNLYWPTVPSVHEGAWLRKIAGSPLSYLPQCQLGGGVNPVRASAIVIRRKPNPISGQSVTLPDPLPATATPS